MHHTPEAAKLTIVIATTLGAIGGYLLGQFLQVFKRESEAEEDDAIAQINAIHARDHMGV